MRHILHRLFERYLNSGQAAFDTTPRELWPWEQFEPQAQARSSGGGLAELGACKRIHRELEPHH